MDPGQAHRATLGDPRKATAETSRTIGADPKLLGADIGFFAVLHTWGQNLMHHAKLKMLCHIFSKKNVRCVVCQTF